MSYSRKKCIEAKDKLGKYNEIGVLWRDNFAGSNSIGNMTNLFRKHIPISDGDFYEKYISYANENKNLPIKERGLTNDELIRLSKTFMEEGNSLIKIKYDYDTYYNCALCHIITETYDGKIQETIFTEYLKSLGYKCEYFSGRIDAKYGVDIKVTNDKGKVFGIQIKPVSFFKSKRKDVIMDKINMCHKYEDCLRDLNIKTYYAIYKKNDNDVIWLKKDNGYRFKINDLFTYDINDIDNTFKERGHLFL